MNRIFIVTKIRGEVSTEQLIKRGLKVGRNFKRLGGGIIDDSHCWLITIGDNVTLAQRVHILAHDASTKTVLNHTKIGLIENNKELENGTYKKTGKYNQRSSYFIYDIYTFIL